MTDIVLESVRVVIVLCLILYLWHAGRERFQPSRKGWRLILGGFSLLLLGSIFDVTDNFESLNRFVIIGDTEAEALLENVVGSIGGFVLLAVGLLRWVPSVQQLSVEDAERKRAEQEIAEKSALLETTLEKMSHGITVYDRNLNLLAFNERYVDLWDYPAGFIRLGMPFEEVARFGARRGDYGPGDVDELVRQRVETRKRGEVYQYERVMPNGTIMAINREAMPGGGTVTTYTDITGRKKAEEEIAEKSTLLETTFESMSQGFAAYDADLRLTAFNRRYLELRDYPPGFIHLGMPFEKIARYRAERGDYGPGDVEELVKGAMERARLETVERSERTLPDGLVTSVVRDPVPGGGFVVTITDITEHKRTEQEIAEKSALLETTFEKMSHGMTVYDADLKLIGFNQKYIEMTGYPPDFIRLGKPFEEISRFRAKRGDYGPGDVEELVRERVAARRKGEAIRRESTLPDGRVIAIRRDPMPAGGCVVTFTDITERKKAEQENAEKSAVLETTFESMSQGIAAFDADLKLIAYNQQYLDLRGYPKGFFHLGQSYDKIIRFNAERGEFGPGDSEKQARERIDNARQGTPWRSEYTRSSGTSIAVRLDPMPGGGFVVTFTDITERKRAEKELAEKSVVLETTFESISQGIVVYDGDLNLVACNQNYVDFCGYPTDFIRLGMAYEDIIRFKAKRGDYGPVEDIDALVRERVAGRREGEAVHRERTLADGRVITVRRDPMPDGGYVTTFTDVTERKRAEREIAEKSALLETTFESMSQGIIAYDGDIKVVAFNQNYVDFWGYPPGFIRLGMSYEDIARAKAKNGAYGPVADIERLVRERMAARRKSNKAVRHERTLLDGRVIAVHRDPTPDGGCVTTFTDITERKRAEEEIAEKSALIETTLESMSQGITVYDANHGLIAFNRNFVELFDFPPDYLRPGKTFEDLARFLAERGEYGPGDVDELVRKRMADRDLGGINPRERTRPDGTVISARRDPMPGGGYVTTYTDITERKRAEAALTEREEQLSLLLRSTGESIYGLDTDGNCTFCNPACLNLLGYDEPDDLLGRNMHDLIHHTRVDGAPYPADACQIYQAFRRGASVGVDDEVLWRRDGTSFPAEYRSFPVRKDGEVVGAVVTFTDITERKRAEEALRAREARLSELQTELLNVSRQSAMGQLSSALAHELNQPLAAIMNYIQAGRRMMKKGGGVVSEKAYQMMDKALDQADRAGAIMRGLREIVEKGEAARAASDINKVVEEASALGLIGAARAGIRLDLEFGNELPPVNINEIQIQQVVMNLVRNGVEAMAVSEKRDLTIKTALDHEDAVEIAIGDTGPGLAEEVKERLFQPFVSTKAGGMGIGLSISHSIVEAHGGRLWATPAPDGGTVFHFTLPLAPNGAEDNDE